MSYYPLLAWRAATILYHSKQVVEAMSYYPLLASRAATILYRSKQVVEAMSYYPLLAWRAATIPYRSKQVVEAMWGRLLTCGRLLIGQLPVTSDNCLRLAAMWGRMAGVPSGSGRWVVPFGPGLPLIVTATPPRCGIAPSEPAKTCVSS
jgi:hypothetical protein